VPRFVESNFGMPACRNWQTRWTQNPDEHLANEYASEYKTNTSDSHERA
jgi:hypothetical protein